MKPLLKKTFLAALPLAGALVTAPVASAYYDDDYYGYGRPWWR